MRRGGSLVIVVARALLEGSLGGGAKGRRRRAAWEGSPWGLPVVAAHGAERYERVHRLYLS